MELSLTIYSVFLGISGSDGATGIIRYVNKTSKAEEGRLLCLYVWLLQNYVPALAVAQYLGAAQFKSLLTHPVLLPIRSNIK
jgi:hypothetical protein